MRRRFPSLKALNAFEAAGRHESFTRAADELHVTPGAISRQVALLEAHFGCSLFVRRGRGMELTGKGRLLLRAAGEAFDRLDAASAQLLGAAGSRLALKSYPTFATEWLVPRLDRFRAAHPWIDFRLTTSLEPVDFRRDDVDLAVSQLPQHDPDISCVELFRPIFLPVCSPTLLRKGPPLATPDDLRGHTLIYTLIQKPMWLAWLDRAGVEGIDPERGLLFENSSLSYHAAREGLGVVLGQRLFVADDIAAGRLAAPFEQELSPRQSYCLLCPARVAEAPAVAAFRRWLIAEIAAAERLRGAPDPEAQPSVQEAPATVEGLPVP